MNIIEWLGENVDAFDAIVFALIALAIWFIVWKLLGNVLEKYKLYSLMELGVMGSYLILVFFAFIVVLFIASIQGAMEYGIKLALPLLIFWGGFTAFVIFFVKKFRNK